VSGDGWNCDHSGGVVTCTRSSFSTGAAPGIVITVTAPVSNGTITNTAVVTSTTTDPLPANNTDAEQTRVIVPGAEQADLAITATDNPDPVNASAPLTYTLAVSNSGLDTAVVVTVTDLLPSRAAFGSVSGEGWNCDHAGGVVTCSRPTLAVGVAPGIVIAVAAPASGGTISNTAWVTSTTTDPDLTDNASTEQTIVTPPAAEQADLSIAKADGPDPVSASATLIYTLTVSNGGPYTATDVTVIDMLPPEVTFGGVLGDGWNCDHAGGKVTCGRSDLGVMTAPDIVISVTAPQSGGMIINGVVVSGQEVDPNLEDNTATAYTQVNSVAVHHLVYLPLIVK
jgi:uncharacterized repeat protein (TIGR01451 family)